jgi:hypothetical protein
MSIRFESKRIPRVDDQPAVLMDHLPIKGRVIGDDDNAVSLF